MKKTAFLTVAVILVISLLVSGCDTKGNATEDELYSTPQEKTIEGYPVYYVVWADLFADYLKIETTEREYVTVVNIGQNLTVTVNDKYGGTALIVKHWQFKHGEYADLAELSVRTKEHKSIWEEAIRKKVAEYNKTLSPQDVLPEP